MIEKQLELITEETLHLNHYYSTEEENVNSTGTTVTVKGFQTLFGFIRGSNYGENNRVGNSEFYIKIPSHMVDVKALGYVKSMNVLDLASITTNITIKDLKENHLKIWNLYKKDYDKEFIKNVNQILVDNRESSKAKVKKLYDEMLTIHTELGYKADVRNIEAMNSLLYCEAQGLLMKMEDNINKKSNAKRITLYKALCAIRDKTPVECS